MKKQLLSLALLSLIAGSTPAIQTMEYVQSGLGLIGKYPKTALLTATVLIAPVAHQKLNAMHQKSLHWDWDNIDPTQIDGKPMGEFFKEYHEKLKQEKGADLLLGAGSSAHQVEGGCTNNQWYEWSQEQKQKDAGMVDAGNACDNWNRYKQDIQLVKNANLNTLRLSVEWSKVMPQPGVVDPTVLQHYKNVCKECRENGIKPVITLFHYTEPLWFYHKTRKVDVAQFPHLKKLAKPGENTLELAGWEDPENIKHFVQFCEVTFDALHDDVHLWLTFNSPEGHAAQGWLTGTKPPAKRSMPLMAEVLKNLLEAHVQTYTSLKNRKGGKEARIGMLKNIMQLDPYDVCNPLDHIASYMGNKLVNNSIYDFFKTGTFAIKVPFVANLTHTNEYVKNGGKINDFIGLNYYCHAYMKNFKTVRDQNEIPTDNPNYTIYGEGLYRAIKELSENIAQPQDIPIYITENGIGTDNDEHRELFNKRSMFALAKAISAGYDVRGHINWALMDNYEWGTFKNKHYGLYHVDFATQKRTLKPGAQYYVNLAKQTLEMPK